MSIKMMFSAMQVKVGSPTTKMVLLKLADNANDKGECWPSYDNIAEVCEISRRSAINHIDKLIKQGLVRKEERKGPKGNSSNVYFLTLDGEKSAPPPSEKSAPCGEKSAPPPSEKSAPESVSSESVKEPVKTKAKSVEQVIVDLYNQILANKENQYSLPQVKVITDKRKKVISKFWLLIEKDLNKVTTYFNWIISNANDHKWLFGANDRNWVADIEYICRDETLAKATENRLSDWRDAA